jgi:hypothetical protein
MTALPEAQQKYTLCPCPVLTMHGLSGAIFQPPRAPALHLEGTCPHVQFLLPLQQDARQPCCPCNTHNPTLLPPQRFKESCCPCSIIKKTCCPCSIIKTLLPLQRFMNPAAPAATKTQHRCTCSSSLPPLWLPCRPRCACSLKKCHLSAQCCPCSSPMQHPSLHFCPPPRTQAH